MTLVDTSVWVAHLRSGDAALRQLLENGEVLTHPFVTGELACGNLSKRAEVLRHLDTLPRAAVARDTEVRRLVEDHRLYGRGIGWIDAHLLASALLSHCRLWSHDQRLRAVAARVGAA